MYVSLHISVRICVAMSCFKFHMHQDDAMISQPAHTHAHAQGKVPLEINCHSEAVADSVSGTCTCLPLHWGDGKTFCNGARSPVWELVEAHGEAPPAIKGHALAQVCARVCM